MEEAGLTENTVPAARLARFLTETIMFIGDQLYASGRLDRRFVSAMQHAWLSDTSDVTVFEWTAMYCGF